MTKIHERIEFPCGMKIEYNINSYSFIGKIKIKIDDEDLPVCPLHGKNCKRYLK